MGKQHKKKARRAAAREPLAKSAAKVEQEKAIAEVASARTPKLLKGLSSSDPGIRSASCAAVVALLADDRGAAKMLQHFVKNGVAAALMERMSDRVQEVRLHAVGALRNITVVGSAKACELLLRLNILTPLLALIPSTLARVGGAAGGGGATAAQGGATVVAAERKIDCEALLLLEQTLTLATNLCEFSEAAVASIMSTGGVVQAVLGCTHCEDPVATESGGGHAAASAAGSAVGSTGSSAAIPMPEGEAVVSAAAQLLHVLSEGNEQFAVGVLSSQAAVVQMLATARRPDIGLTGRVHLAAALHAVVQMGGSAAAMPAAAAALLPAVVEPVMAALKTDCGALLVACAERTAQASAREEAAATAAAAKQRQPKGDSGSGASAAAGAADGAIGMADSEEMVEDAGPQEATPEEQGLKLWHMHMSALLVALEVVANACTTDEGGAGAELWESDDEEEMERAAASGLGIAVPQFAGGSAAHASVSDAMDAERTMLALLSSGVPAAVLLVLQQVQAQLDRSQSGELLPKHLDDLQNAHHMACVSLSNLLQNGPLASLGGSLQQVFDSLAALSMTSIQKQGASFFKGRDGLPSQSESITNAVRSTALRAVESQLPLAASPEQLNWLAHICVAGAGAQCLCTATRVGAATILGALGQLPHDADMNMRLGSALAGCLEDSSLPVLVEAANAIIDVYSKDELHVMFVALKLPEQLPQLLNHIAAKLRELKGKVGREEIAYYREIKLNLSRFIKYKQKQQ